MKTTGRLMLVASIFWILIELVMLVEHREHPWWLIGSLAATVFITGILVGGRVALWTLRGGSR